MLILKVKSLWFKKKKYNTDYPITNFRPDLAQATALRIFLYLRLVIWNTWHSLGLDRTTIGAKIVTSITERSKMSPRSPIYIDAGQTSTRLRSGGAAADPYSIMTRTDHNWDQSRLCSFTLGFTQVIFYLGQRHYEWTNRRSRNFPFGFFALK